MIELVIYALLAAFIFSRLYNSLGRSTSSNIKKLTNIIDANQEEKNIVENVENYIYNDTDSSSIKATYEQILQINKNFSIFNFMKGSSLVFELVIKYYNQGNLPKLKPLLDKELYSNFVEKIKYRKEVQESIIVSIITQKILEIKLIKDTVHIVVYFLSDQINFIKNDKGEIISGNTSTINKVEDIWQFKKNITFSNPKWLLTSVEYKKEDNEH
ncbi:MAG: Tim44/TimA family putative adaptor protein [Wolbachia endosymbiont of Menacanthus eurysternus]|nr:MAG: Tim44/TimA family putative adaptor protein [Wolbachia endosymbiont of Menacanthus eurysternus]